MYPNLDRKKCNRSPSAGGISRKDLDKYGISLGLDSKKYKNKTSLCNAILSTANNKSSKTVIKKSPKTVIKKSSKTTIKKSPKTVIKKSPKTTIKKSPKTVIKKSSKTTIKKSPKTNSDKKSWNTKKTEKTKDNQLINQEQFKKTIVKLKNFNSYKKTNSFQPYIKDNIRDLNGEFLMKREISPELQEVWGKDEYSAWRTYNILREKVGSDFYRYLGDNDFFVPDTYIAMEDDNVEGLVIKFHSDFIEFKKKNVWDENSTERVNIKKLASNAIVTLNKAEGEYEKIQVPSYASLCIISYWLGDWDIINSEGENVGLIPKEGEYILMKIDFGKSFEFRKMNSKQIYRGPSEIVFDYNSASKSPLVRYQIGKTAQKIVDMKDDDIKFLIFGNKNRNIPWSKSSEKFYQKVENIFSSLVERKQRIAELYEDDIEFYNNFKKKE